MEAAGLTWSEIRSLRCKTVGAEFPMRDTLFEVWLLVEGVAALLLTSVGAGARLYLAAQHAQPPPSWVQSGQARRGMSKPSTALDAAMSMPMA
jgi:hypothetical protein